MQKTLIIFKPDAIQRGVVGEILTRFERAGLKIIALKMVQPDEEHYFHHYENISKMISRRGKKAFDVTLKMMQEGPVIAVVLSGVEAVALVRKMVGTTEPKAASPGTIRGDYAHVSFAHADDQDMGIPNIIHASGDSDEAEKEIKHWFTEEELFNYQTVHEVYTQPKAKN